MSKRANCRGAVPYSISQNFITCSRTIERLLNLTTIGKADLVWEIGPGKGHFTRRLLPRCARMTAVEIDPALHRYLASKLADAPGLRLIRADFLDTRLPASGAYKVFSNLPFSHTSAILRKLTTAPNPPQDSWLIMEKGAAKRFLGKPLENVHSLTLKAFFDARIVHHLPREAFHPMPSVDCVMVHLHRKPAPDITPAQRPMLDAFVRAMQSGRAGAPLSGRQAAMALRQAGLADIPQSATMSYVQWLCLFRWWARLSQGKHAGI